MELEIDTTIANAGTHIT